MMKVSSTLYLRAEHVTALQELAGRLGYNAGAGSAAGQGSASALVRKLAEEPMEVAEAIIRLYEREKD
jgi:hypothetical protein